MHIWTNVLILSKKAYLCARKLRYYGKRNQKSTALAGWQTENRLGKTPYAPFELS